VTPHLAFPLSTLESPKTGYADAGFSLFSSQPPGTMPKFGSTSHIPYSLKIIYSLIIEFSTVYYLKNRNDQREQIGIRSTQSTKQSDSRSRDLAGYYQLNHNTVEEGKIMK
jgi:hypothetical protein